MKCNMHILVVEDNKFTLTVLEKVLIGWGYMVTTAENGMIAWEKLKTLPSISIVISDWQMPEMNGIELCQRIREEITDRYIYYILLTARSKQEDMMTALKAGADDFLTKSVEHDELQVRMYSARRVIELEQALIEKNEALENMVRDLYQATQHIHEDLQAAATMQTELLPPQGKITGCIQSFWYFEPADYIAGDIFNCFSLSETQLAFYSIDVSGHGVPAALLSFTLHNMLRIQDYGVGLEQEMLFHPEKVISKLNQYFEKDTPGSKYFTMIYGVIDTENGDGKLCQAGHPSPFKQSADGKIDIIGLGGFPVGLIPDADYEEVSFKLDAGDRILIYSDGVTDCENRQNIAFGKEQLTKYLQDSDNLSTSDMLDKLSEYLQTWQGNQQATDDISILVLEHNYDR